MIINGWYVCPYCKTKICKVSNDSIAKGLKVKCKRCKNEFEIIIPVPMINPVSNTDKR